MPPRLLDFSVSCGLVHVNSPLRTLTLLCDIFLPDLCISFILLTMY